jgi:hypothetical protein
MCLVLPVDQMYEVFSLGYQEGKKDRMRDAEVLTI